MAGVRYGARTMPGLMPMQRLINSEQNARECALLPICGQNESTCHFGALGGAVICVGVKQTGATGANQMLKKGSASLVSVIRHYGDEKEAGSCEISW